MRVGGNTEPGSVAVGVEITGVVQRDRLEVHAHRAVDLRRRDAGAQHRGGVVGARRAGHDETGNVTKNGDTVVVVKVPAEAALVAKPLNSHDHAVAIRALREETERRSLAAQLILGVVEVREVLDLGDRNDAGDGRAEGQPEDRGLVEERVEDALRPEPRLQAARDPVHATLRSDVLAEDERLRVGVEHIGQRGVDRLGERERLGVAKPGGSRLDLDRDRGARRERRHHVGRSRELRVTRSLECPLANAHSRLEVVLGERLSGHGTDGDQDAGQREQRIG